MCQQQGTCGPHPPQQTSVLSSVITLVGVERRQTAARTQRVSLCCAAISVTLGSCSLDAALHAGTVAAWAAAWSQVATGPRDVNSESAEPSTDTSPPSRWRHSAHWLIAPSIFRFNLLQTERRLPEQLRVFCLWGWTPTWGIWSSDLFPGTTWASAHTVHWLVCYFFLFPSHSFFLVVVGWQPLERSRNKFAWELARALTVPAS